MRAARQGTESAKPAEFFVTTQWSVVVTAGTESNPEAAAAMERLCRTYWYPLYVFIRSSGYSSADAEDLTQEFFSRLIAKHYLAAVHRERGRFRWFLLSALKRFLLNERARQGAAKRGGLATHVPFDGERAEERYRLEASGRETPDKLFDRAWATDLIQQAHQRLQQEYARADKRDLFEHLTVFLCGDKGALTYAETGAGLGMSEGAIKVAVHRLRRRYRELLREQVAQTVHTASELEEELRNLQTAFSSGV